MRPARVHCHNGLSWDLKFESEKPVELFVDDLRCLQAKNPNVTTVLFLCEPEDIQHLNEKAIKHHDKVDFILTHDEKTLEACPNAREFSFGTSWVEEEEVVEKEFSVSHLTGHKQITKGHKLRQKIFFKQDKITIPKNFYLGRNHTGIENISDSPVLGDSKAGLFKSMFHICIENSQKKHYFTEKIVDCCMMKTIPVYWGCSNIGDYFDEEGIIVVDSLKDIINTVNQMTPEVYEMKKKAIENNYKKAMHWADISGRMDEKLKEITNEIL